ncbi:hypothetical protein [Veillonella sp. CHU740]|uniref:hypothetical protein n=1 Tax=Veillonella sp. CHU740 TaxID=2490950 RepID=UPI000F8C89B8|nr:hypothetical protein [Veillonella sp. CHU740]
MKGAIEKGITYVSVDAQELPLEGVQFISQYKEELVDGKQDILAIRSEIEEEIQGYEALLVEVEQKGLLAAMEERRGLLHDAMKEYGNVTDTICSLIDTYIDMGNMIQQIEDRNGNPAYVWHSKQDLLAQNVELNRIFDYVDYYISAIVDMLLHEKEYANRVLEEQIETSSEEDMTQVLLFHQMILTKCVEINKMLIERLQMMVPHIDRIREDMMKLQVHHATNEVEERRKRLQELRNQEQVEDVMDYADLEGQYRHTYDEEGNHVGTEEGGDGGNRKSLTAILVAAALVIIIFAAYVYMK